MNERYPNKLDTDTERRPAAFCRKVGATIAALTLTVGVASFEASDRAAQEFNLQTVSETIDTTVEPTVVPTAEPTMEPTVGLTTEPTVEPTAEPTIEPTPTPTPTPTPVPTVTPTRQATKYERVDLAAHRGYHVAGATENSMEAIKNAIKLSNRRDEDFKNVTGAGKTIVEMDIQKTKDGKLVLMHDWTLNRTTSGTGNVSSHSYSYIYRHRLNNGEHVPTFGQAMKTIAASSKTIEVEVEIKDKDGDVSYSTFRKVRDAIAINRMKGRTEVGSTFSRVLRKFNKLHSGIDTGFITKKWASPSKVNDYADSIIISQSALTAARARSAHSHGLEVAAWTPNSNDDQIRNVQRGVDTLITNAPGLWANTAERSSN